MMDRFDLHDGRLLLVLHDGEQLSMQLSFQVIDRLCLIVFSIFTAAATVGVLLAAPHVIVY